MVEKILDLAIAYNGKDVKRINHLLKVHSFARHIGIMENCDARLQTIIEIAALLHDIGIHESERKYGTSTANWQEIEGPIVAKELFKNLDLDISIQERVLFLIGHHHSYNAIDGIDFQILVEADFLVNIFEHETGKDSLNGIKKDHFKTGAGTRLLEEMYM